MQFHEQKNSNYLISRVFHEILLQVRVYNLIHSIDESANESEENLIRKHINSDAANR